AEPTMICKEARVRKRYRPDVRVGIVGWGAPGHVSAIWGKQVERAIHVGIVRHCEANGHDVASLRLKGPFMFGSWFQHSRNWTVYAECPLRERSGLCMDWERESECEEKSH